MYQSIPSLTISLPPLGQAPREFFQKGRILRPPGTKKVRNSDTWDRKIVPNPTPGGIIFKNPAKRQYRNANMFRNIKTLKHIWVKASWWVTFMDIQNISNHSPFICKPTQEIHDKQVTEYDFVK